MYADPFGQKKVYVICGGVLFYLPVSCFKITECDDGEIHREWLGIFIILNRNWGFLGKYTWEQWQLMDPLNPRPPFRQYDCYC